MAKWRQLDNFRSTVNASHLPLKYEGEHDQKIRHTFMSIPRVATQNSLEILTDSKTESALAGA